MFHKILAAIDVPPMSRLVFDCALSLAKSFDAQLGLLYVFTFEEFETLPAPKLETLDSYPGLLDAPAKCYVGHLETDHLNAFDNPELRLLHSYTHQATEQGISAELFQCIGNPGNVICDFAKAWQADLIVIGHRGHIGFTEFVLGSVSNYVIHHAPCSVHVVHHVVHPRFGKSSNTKIATHQ